MPVTQASLAPEPQVLNPSAQEVDGSKLPNYGKLNKYLNTPKPEVMKLSVPDGSQILSKDQKLLDAFSNGKRQSVMPVRS